MAVMQVNAGSDVPRAVLAAAGALPPGAPVIVMLHGYRFSPHVPPHCRSD